MVSLGHQGDYPIGYFHHNRCHAPAVELWLKEEVKSNRAPLWFPCVTGETILLDAFSTTGNTLY